MLVQYLVGLCALRNNPDAVDVTVGDLVHDTAARKRRDVDVTVTLKEEDGSTRALQGLRSRNRKESLLMWQLLSSFAPNCGTCRTLRIGLHSLPLPTLLKAAINKAAAYNVGAFFVF